MTETEQQLASLEAFTAETDLVLLKAMIDEANLLSEAGEFNLFEAAGLTFRELRHSDFLATLLDPSQPHGLGDRFAKAFLLRALQRHAEPPVAADDLLRMDLSGLVVHRERHRIDLLLVDDRNQILVVIENKILSGERPGQLDRYLDIAKQLCPNHRTLAIYLTPSGAMPSHSAYLAVSYGEVVAMVEEHALLTTGVAADGMRQYAEMLRRHIVSDTDMAVVAACRRICMQHPDALELLCGWRQDMIRRSTSMVRRWITQGRRLKLGDTEPGWISFAPAAWDKLRAQNVGYGWPESKRLVQFEFSAEDGSLCLVVGQGDADVRNSLFRAARASELPWIVEPEQVEEWTLIYGRNLITDGSGDQAPANWEDELTASWEEFVAKDLRELTDLVRQAGEGSSSSRSEPS